MDLKLANKVVFVSGSSSGIGFCGKRVASIAEGRVFLGALKFVVLCTCFALGNANWSQNV